MPPQGTAAILTGAGCSGGPGTLRLPAANPATKSPRGGGNLRPRVRTEPPPSYWGGVASGRGVHAGTEVTVAKAALEQGACNLRDVEQS
jgi:hypothetical protein